MLDDTVDKYKDTSHRTIKIKLIDIKSNSYAEYNVDSNAKGGKYKIFVKISKYKNTFAKRCAPNWSEEIFVISNVKNTAPWTYIISALNGEEIDGTFYEKELQKTNETEFKGERVIKRKGDKLYVK